MKFLTDIKECLQLLSDIKRSENIKQQTKYLEDNQKLIIENVQLKQTLKDRSQAYLVLSNAVMEHVKDSGIYNKIRQDAAKW